MRTRVDPAEALALSREGRFRDAIDSLSALNRRQRRDEWEAWMRDWRYGAAANGPRSGAWPPRITSRFSSAVGVPEISRDALDAEALAEGILGKGALLVRGLLEETQVAHFRDGVEQSLAACSASRESGASSPWYARSALPEGHDIHDGRAFLEDGTGVWMVDSPRFLFDFTEWLEASRIPQVLTPYFGERPLLSMGKCALRRLSANPIHSYGWHQDGAFLGADTRTVNMWISLSHCGVDAPGLAVLPKRMDRIMETGTEGASFHWGLGVAPVEREAADAPIATPVFAPGDALFFDQMLVHRTSYLPTMDKIRYAIECWFFAPSTFPMPQVPLLL